MPDRHGAVMGGGFGELLRHVVVRMRAEFNRCLRDIERGNRPRADLGLHRDPAALLTVVKAGKGGQRPPERPITA